MSDSDPPRHPGLLKATYDMVLQIRAAYAATPDTAITTQT